MNPVQLMLLKLALNACERGDAAGAKDALHAALAADSEVAPTTPSARAVSIGAFAALTGYSRRYVHTLITRGDIPADAVLSSGRGRRILVAAAIEALRSSRRGSRPSLDDVEKEGQEYAMQRRRGAREK